MDFFSPPKKWHLKRIKHSNNQLLSSSLRDEVQMVCRVIIYLHYMCIVFRINLFLRISKKDRKKARNLCPIILSTKVPEERGKKTGGIKSICTHLFSSIICTHVRFYCDACLFCTSHAALLDRFFSWKVPQGGVENTVLSWTP